ncbi:hypothetical protein [Pseudonocardia sp.]|nr:hypothetical protein [Pseudonocardia sp.]
MGALSGGRPTGGRAGVRTALIVTHRPEQTPGLPEVRLGSRRLVPTS